MAGKLVPSDSTQAMASLMSAYGDEEADDDTVHDTSGMAAAQLDDDDVLSPDTRTHPGANFISDDEDGHRSPHERVDESAKQEDTKSPIAERLPPQRTATRLVSYGPDEVDEADDDEDSGESLPSVYNVQNFQAALSRVASAASVARVESDAVHTSSQSPASINEDDIQLPPEAPGNCSKRLQAESLGAYILAVRAKSDEAKNESKIAYKREKIAKHCSTVRDGKDLNAEIQRLKEFRNPSIYEKLIKMCGIDEQGTNYPPELYNPLIWGPESYYDELARIQTEMLHEKEKEAKKSKVEFQKGVKRAVAPADTSATEVKRKVSKWDERSGAAVVNSMTVAAHGSSKPK